jgi:RHS repeat-associated protein
LTFDCAANVCANSTARETWTLRGLDGKVLRVYEHPWDEDWSWQRDYVYRDGQPLVAVEPDQTYHFHLDHLGSPRVVTNAAGTKVVFHAYYPFGLEATDPAQSDFQLKFTGHERDENGGGPKGELDYMMARFCSPVLGRFYSVDPGRDFSTKIPQSWNRYAYARNNPLKYVDPDGRALVPPPSIQDSLTTNAALIGSVSPLPVIGKPLGFALGLVLPTAVDDLNANIVSMGMPLGSSASKGAGLAAKFFGDATKRVLKFFRPGTELSKQAQKGIRSLEKQIVKHEKKLADFKKNPTVRPGMEHLPEDVIRKQQARRIQHLEEEIRAFKENIEKLKQGNL